MMSDRDRYGGSEDVLQDDQAALAAVLRMEQPATIGDLVAQIGRKGAGFRAVVRMISDGALELLSPRIDYDAIVRRRLARM